MAAAESTYIAHLDSTSKYKILPTGVATTRAVAKDPGAHTKDNTPIASYIGGNFTAAKLASYMVMIPPQGRAQIQSAPDSVVPLFIRNVVRNELVVRQADSAKVTLDTSETNEMRRNYEQVITNGWTQIGVDPKMLADSSKTEAGRDRLAAARVEDYLGRVVAGQVRPVNVPPMVGEVMRSKYGYQVNEAGVDRVVAQVAQAKKVADSAHNATLPPTAVPLPGSGPSGSPGGTSGAGSAQRQPQGGGNR
jgi:peptidyl-prolyl cis-trans isomerase D